MVHTCYITCSFYTFYHECFDFNSLVDLMFRTLRFYHESIPVTISILTVWFISRYVSLYFMTRVVVHAMCGNQFPCLVAVLVRTISACSDQAYPFQCLAPITFVLRGLWPGLQISYTITIALQLHFCKITYICLPSNILSHFYWGHGCHLVMEIAILTIDRKFYSRSRRITKTLGRTRYSSSTVSKVVPIVLDPAHIKI